MQIASVSMMTNPTTTQVVSADRAEVLELYSQISMVTAMPSVVASSDQGSQQVVGPLQSKRDLEPPRTSEALTSLVPQGEACSKASEASVSQSQDERGSQAAPCPDIQMDESVYL